MLLIGATIWTVVVKKTQSVNGIMVGQPGNMVPLGIDVTIGSALYLAWAGFGTLLASIIPYMIRQVLQVIHQRLQADVHAAAAHTVDSLSLMQAVSHDLDPLGQASWACGDDKERMGAQCDAPLCILVFISLDTDYR